MSKAIWTAEWIFQTESPSLIFYYVFPKYSMFNHIKIIRQNVILETSSQKRVNLQSQLTQQSLEIERWTSKVRSQKSRVLLVHAEPLDVYRSCLD